MATFINILEKLTPIIRIIISSFVSYFVAKINVQNEIKKTLLSFEREDKQALDEAFTSLMTTTKELCLFNCNGNIYEAVEANTRFLTLAPEEFHPIITQMHTAIENHNFSDIEKLRKDLLQMYSHKN